MMRGEKEEENGVDCFQQIAEHFFDFKLSIKTKDHVFNTNISPVLLYGSKTQKETVSEELKMSNT